MRRYRLAWMLGCVATLGLGACEPLVDELRLQAAALSIELEGRPGGALELKLVLQGCKQAEVELRISGQVVHALRFDGCTAARPCARAARVELAEIGRAVGLDANLDRSRRTGWVEADGRCEETGIPLSARPLEVAASPLLRALPAPALPRALRLISTQEGSLGLHFLSNEGAWLLGAPRAPSLDEGFATEWTPWWTEPNRLEDMVGNQEGLWVLERCWVGCPPGPRRRVRLATESGKLRPGTALALGSEVDAVFGHPEGPAFALLDGMGVAELSVGPLGLIAGPPLHLDRRWSRLTETLLVAETAPLELLIAGAEGLERRSSDVSFEGRIRIARAHAGYVAAPFGDRSTVLRFPIEEPGAAQTFDVPDEGVLDVLPTARGVLYHTASELVEVGADGELGRWRASDRPVQMLSAGSQLWVVFGDERGFYGGAWRIARWTGEGLEPVLDRLLPSERGDGTFVAPFVYGRGWVYGTTEDMVFGLRASD